MKIRIQGNSIRFRLKQFEVDRFQEQGEIREVLSFGNDAKEQFQFILNRTDDNSYSLKQDGTAIILNVPHIVAVEWTTTALVGFEEKIITEAGKEINVLVEKDFKCLDRTEDEPGSYPNPLEAMI
jgi:hypothetical protein